LSFIYNYDSPVAVYRSIRVCDAVKRVCGFDCEPKFGLDGFLMWYLPLPMLKGLDEVDDSYRCFYDVVGEALGSEETKKGRVSTVLDSFMSTLSAISFVKGFFEALKKKAKEFKEEGNQSCSEGLNNLVDKIQQEGLGKDLKLEGEVKEAVSKCVSEALKETREAQKSIEVLGRLAGVGHVESYGEFIADASELALNLQVRRILELARGIIEDISRFTKIKKLERKHGEVDGITLGDDVDRVLVSELTLPDEIFYTKYIERGLLVQRRIVRETKGACYCLVDKSGSMADDPPKTVWSRAVAVALLNRALREGREFYMRFFDNMPFELMTVKRGENPLKMLKYLLTLHSRGGTDIYNALRKGCEDIIKDKVKGTSTIYIITDGEDEVPSTVKDLIKKANAEVISVMVRGQNKTLKDVSKKYFEVKQLSGESGLEIVEA